ncbi:DUF6542 domain-containing protein [Streptomyces sp. NPDC047928]|uniref:DUF6542 domain-containing protein n=1 Tax=unclassified Streptomyces TaxID=2593676 RepID=UPI00371FCDBC
MEQHRSSPPRRPQRVRPGAPQPQAAQLIEGAAVRPVRRPPGGATGAPGPGGAGGGAGSAPGGRPRPAPGRRPVPPVVLALRRLPAARLTGLGAGLFAAAAMFLLGCVDWLLFDGSPAVYGVLFLLVSALTALWVRGADLVTAPIGVPIAFAVGVVPIAGGTGGIGGQAMAVVTALAVHAGWLYGGTLVAGVIASVRKVRLMGRRQQRAAAAAEAAAAAAAASAAQRRS